MMKTITGAGMCRLANPWTIAVVALTAATTSAMAQPTRAVRVTADTLVKTDSVRIMTTGPGLMVLLKKIDSMVRLQNGMTIGSAEYARVEEELHATIRASMSGVGTRTFSVKVDPDFADQAVRAAGTSTRANVDAEPRGWLGIKADGLHQEWKDPSGAYIRYFVYPTVVAVDPNSPAAKVGFQFGDSLLAYDGADLRRNTINLTRLLEPGRTLKVTLRRDGATKDVSVIPDKIPPSAEHERMMTTVVEMLAPARAPVMIADSMERRFAEKRAQAYAARAGGTAGPSNTRVATMIYIGIPGARMSDLDSAATLALTQQKVSRGVLVTAVAAESPAARMGLRGLDLIVAVSDVDVTSASQVVRELSARGPGRVTTFVVLRAGKTEKLVYDPRVP